MMGMEAVVVALQAEMPHMVETRVVRKLQRAKGGMMKETSTRGSIPTILSQQVAEVGGMAAGHTRRMISLVVADLGTLVGSQGVALNREAMVQQIRVAMVQTVHRQELAVAAILAMLQKMVLSGLPFSRTGRGFSVLVSAMKPMGTGTARAESMGIHIFLYRGGPPTSRLSQHLATTAQMLRIPRQSSSRAWTVRFPPSSRLASSR
jgi:hypothetical protein